MFDEISLNVLIGAISEALADSLLHNTMSWILAFKRVFTAKTEEQFVFSTQNNKQTEEYVFKLLALLLKVWMLFLRHLNFLQPVESAYFSNCTQFSNLLTYLCTMFCTWQFQDLEAVIWQNNDILKCVFMEKKKTISRPPLTKTWFILKNSEQRPC